MQHSNCRKTLYLQAAPSACPPRVGTVLKPHDGTLFSPRGILTAMVPCSASDGRAITGCGSRLEPLGRHLRPLRRTALPRELLRQSTGTGASRATRLCSSDPSRSEEHTSELQ